MQNGRTVRRALDGDVVQICAVVRASIIELCFPDHQNDPRILGQWLANKTPETVAHWLSVADNINLVAVEGPTVIGAGCVTTAGEVVLNYVSPNARFGGVSSALLSGLETTAKELGHRRCFLDSTLTAHDFYLGRNYTDAGAASKKFGLMAFPMVKDF